MARDRYHQILPKIYRQLPENVYQSRKVKILGTFEYFFLECKFWILIRIFSHICEAKYYSSNSLFIEKNENTIFIKERADNKKRYTSVQ